MAADTAIKRLSAMNLTLPWRGPAVIPSGTVDAGERAAALHLYSGVGAAAATVSGGKNHGWLYPPSTPHGAPVHSGSSMGYPFRGRWP